MKIDILDPASIILKYINCLIEAFQFINATAIKNFYFYFLCWIFSKNNIAVNWDSFGRLLWCFKSTKWDEITSIKKS